MIAQWVRFQLSDLCGVGCFDVTSRTEIETYVLEKR